MFKIEKYANDAIIRWAWTTNDARMPRAFWTSVYLVDGLLIDSGAPASNDELQEFISELPREQVIEQAILTHWHEDHAGGAHLLTKLGIPVYIHELGLNKVREGFSYPNYRELAWGGPLEPAPAVQSLETSSIITKSGEYTFELLHYVGHSDDLIVLLEPIQQWCFVSDSLQPKYQMIFGEPSEDMHEDIQLIHASLKHLQEYTCEMDNLIIFTAAFGMFPGHEILTKNISQIENFHKQVHELKTEGLGERKIVKKLFGDEHLAGQISNNALSRLNFVKSLLKWPLTFD